MVWVTIFSRLESTTWRWWPFGSAIGTESAVGSGGLPPSSNSRADERFVTSLVSKCAQFPNQDTPSQSCRLDASARGASTGRAFSADRPSVGWKPRASRSRSASAESRVRVHEPVDPKRHRAFEDLFVGLARPLLTQNRRRGTSINSSVNVGSVNREQIACRLRRPVFRSACTPGARQHERLRAAHTGNARLADFRRLVRKSAGCVPWRPQRLVRARSRTVRRIPPRWGFQEA